MDSANIVIDQLARTKGWTRLMSVILWILGVLLVLMAVGMGIVGFTGALDSGTAAISSVATGITLASIYLIMAILHIYPAMKLASFSTTMFCLQRRSMPKNQKLICLKKKIAKPLVSRVVLLSSGWLRNKKVGLKCVCNCRLIEPATLFRFSVSYRSDDSNSAFSS